MKKYLFLITLFLTLLSLLLYYRNSAKINQEKAELYYRNSEILNQRIRRIYHEKIELEKQKEELETAAQNDHEIFNWYYDISHTAVIKRLQQNKIH